MYRDSIKFITKIDESKMSASMLEIWRRLSDLDKLTLIKEANRDLIQQAVDRLNENHSWAFLEMKDR
jgi:hypothetical protein